MLVDWFHVAAQAVNFLILLWLLRRYLYRPVVATMAARRKRIERQLEEARRLREEAEALKRQYEARLARVAEEERRLLEEVKERVEAERQRLLEAARKEVEEKRQAWLEALSEEQERFWREMEKRFVEALLQIARKAFMELAGMRLEEAIVTAFLEKIGQKGEALKAAREIRIATSFPLDPPLRQRIELLLRNSNPKASIRFEQDPELICGIELEASGYLWSWSLKGYLEALREELEKWMVQAAA